jgi:hypothetical protein
LGLQLKTRIEMPKLAFGSEKVWMLILEIKGYIDLLFHIVMNLFLEKRE